MGKGIAGVLLLDFGVWKDHLGGCLVIVDLFPRRVFNVIELEIGPLV